MLVALRDQQHTIVQPVHILISSTLSMGKQWDDAELDSIESVIGLSPRDPLKDFGEMWYQVFLWALFSSILVHCVAAAIAFARLRKHKMGRLVPAFILAMGILSPITGGVVTSATIAGVYRASNFEMKPLYALVWGVGQTIVVIFISFTRILATL